MKAEIHPTYFPKATVECACGNKFTVGSSKESIRVEICSKCHPFYTGQEKSLDSAGRVEKFKNRRAAAAPKVSKKNAEVVSSTPEQTPSDASASNAQESAA